MAQVRVVIRKDGTVDVQVPNPATGAAEAERAIRIVEERLRVAGIAFTPGELEQHREGDHEHEETHVHAH